MKPACEVAEVGLRTYRRWVTSNGQVTEDQRPLVVRLAPTNKLTKQEVESIVAACNQPEFASLPPSQIVPRLADRGTYIASESSFYRILKAKGLLNHRGRSQKPGKKKLPTSHSATGPNQVWSWDITYCSTTVRGLFYYLYLIEDIFSRKIVGYEVHEQETGEHAASLLQRTVLREQCFNQPLVLHSDNGAPMKSVTMKTKMEDLGVTGSHSRPRVSNDNPFSESLFRTLKYSPTWPSNGFKSLAETRNWVQDFVDWYNEDHRHSRIGFVTPVQKHLGEDALLLAQRKVLYENAKRRNPARWSGETRKWEPVTEVTLNPEKPENTKLEAAA